MSLDYNWTKCSEEAANKLKEVDGFCWNLSVATMAAGINKITDENVNKFWQRYCAMQHALGSGTYINLEDVRLCVGFSTNVSPQTDAAFKKHLADTVMRNALTLVKHHNA